MKKTVRMRRGIEVLRSLRPHYSRERDELYRKLTALTARKGGIEVQLKSYEERVEALTEILQKLRKEESELTSLLKSDTNFPSNNGGDKKQCAVPETKKGGEKEMVFRF